jgi:hypothetical protein
VTNFLRRTERTELPEEIWAVYISHPYEACGYQKLLRTPTKYLSDEQLRVLVGAGFVPHRAPWYSHGHKESIDGMLAH